MSIQSLTPPQDITWTRMLFSRDMVDTNFDQLNFPPRWRSSFAVYYYIVPEEETVDAYPNSKIVYLKLTSSITGWNPSEALENAKKIARESGDWSDMQRTLWEVIKSSGWAEKYWPCLGAIIQIAVYPNKKEGVSPDDYPYIMDFEPKKRELYESVSEGGEMLSASSDKLAVSKGTTNTYSMEMGAKASVGGALAKAVVGSAELSTTIGYGHNSVENRNTDTSREARETQSHSVTFNQMYQLFNGYHLGTNRALFVMSPRPHTVSSVDRNQIEASLVNGERKLEGIQDIFLVVHMPKSMDGFCVQASLDTGHLAVDNLTNAENLIITRRIAQSCGTFDENGVFTLKKIKEPIKEVVVGEVEIDSTKIKPAFRIAPKDGSLNERISAANNLNALQAKISQSIVDKISAGDFEYKAFQESKTFRRLTAATIGRKNLIKLDQLKDLKIISKEVSDKLKTLNVKTADDLFNSELAKDDAVDLDLIRNNIVKYMMNIK